MITNFNKCIMTLTNLVIFGLNRLKLRHQSEISLQCLRKQYKPQLPFKNLKKEK